MAVAINARWSGSSVSTNVRLLGIGELIVDHIFLRSSDSYKYLESRGGGSVANILTQLSVGGLSTAFFSIGGDDRSGQYAKAELSAFGVNVENIRLNSKKPTHSIFHIVQPREGLSDSTFSHSFQLSCPCGGREAKQFTTLATGRLWEDAERALISFDALCVDRINKHTVMLAKKARQLGKLAFLDLGRSSYLRYYTASRLLSSLEPFDLVLMPQKVWRLIAKRSAPDRNLYGRDFARHAIDMGLHNIIIVTDAENDILIFDLREGASTLFSSLRPFNGTPVETSGAGDALFANLLLQIFSEPDRNSRVPALPRDSINAHLTNAISRLGPVLSHIGARGHIASVSPRPENPWLGVKDKLSFCSETNAKSDQECPFCSEKCESRHIKDRQNANIEKKRPVSTVISNNVINLVSKTNKILVETDAVEQCRQIFEEIDGTTFVVGSGGSHPVASFIALGLNSSETKTGLAVAIYPLDYLKLNRKTNNVIIISYSGKTPDCAHVIESALRLNVERIILVTGAADPDLASPENIRRGLRVLSYGSSTTKLERGFVSVTGTVAPCAIWCTAFRSLVEVQKVLMDFNYGSGEIKNIARSFFGGGEKYARLSGNKVEEGNKIFNLSIIGGGISWPAMLDLESKFTEGDIGVIRVHEEKDFSHGRFMSLLTDNHHADPVLIFDSGLNKRYRTSLVRAVSSRSNSGTKLCQVLDSPHSGMLASLDLLVKAQLFVREIAGLMGVDISRPGDRLPSRGLSLYKWKGLLD
jgi:sugar/nucleoside kinase (ribokinase family)/fructoselysine-6-P-deglycase FrlB-like protein